MQLNAIAVSVRLLSHQDAPGANVTLNSLQNRYQRISDAGTLYVYRGFSKY